MSHRGSRKSVAALGAFDVDGSGEWMDEVQVHGRDILRLRIEVEIGIERITRFQDEELPRLHTGCRLDGEVIAIEAVGSSLQCLPDFPTVMGAGPFTSLVSAKPTPVLPIRHRTAARDSHKRVDVIGCPP